MLNILQSVFAIIALIAFIPVFSIGTVWMSKSIWSDITKAIEKKDVGSFILNTCMGVVYIAILGIAVIQGINFVW